MVQNKTLIGCSIALRPVLLFIKSLVTKLAQKEHISAEHVALCMKYCLKLEPIPFQSIQLLAFICQENNVSVVVFTVIMLLVISSF